METVTGKPKTKRKEGANERSSAEPSADDQGTSKPNGPGVVPFGTARQQEPGLSGPIDQIREIIVGGHLEEMERRFDSLEARFTARHHRLVDDMEARVSTTIQGLEQRIETLSRLMSSRSEAHTDAMKAADERLAAATELLRTTFEGLGGERGEWRRELVERDTQLEERRDHVDKAIAAIEQRITDGGRQLMKEIFELRKRMDQETKRLGEETRDIRRFAEQGFAAFSERMVERHELSERLASVARAIGDE